MTFEFNNWLAGWSWHYLGHFKGQGHRPKVKVTVRKYVAKVVGATPSEVYPVGLYLLPVLTTGVINWKLCVVNGSYWGDGGRQNETSERGASQGRPRERQTRVLRRHYWWRSAQSLLLSVM